MVLSLSDDDIKLTTQMFVYNSFRLLSVDFTSAGCSDSVLLEADATDASSGTLKPASASRTEPPYGEQVLCLQGGD